MSPLRREIVARMTYFGRIPGAGGGNGIDLLLARLVRCPVSGLGEIAAPFSQREGGFIDSRKSAEVSARGFPLNIWLARGSILRNIMQNCSLRVSAGYSVVSPGIQTTL